MENTEDRHDGWTNQETAGAYHWLTNDGGLCQLAYGITAKAVQESIGQSFWARGGKSVPRKTLEVRSAANAIQGMVTTWLDGCVNGPWDSRLGLIWSREIGSMWRVDWEEIARAFLVKMAQSSRSNQS